MVGGDAPDTTPDWISDIQFTLRTFQAAMFWLNAVALANIPLMKMTFATFQAAMPWLNAVA